MFKKLFSKCFIHVYFIICQKSCINISLMCKQLPIDSCLCNLFRSQIIMMMPQSAFLDVDMLTKHHFLFQALKFSMLPVKGMCYQVFIKFRVLNLTQVDLLPYLIDSQVEVQQYPVTLQVCDICDLSNMRWFCYCFSKKSLFS